MGSGESKEASGYDADNYVGEVPVVTEERKENSFYLSEELSDFKILVKTNSKTWRFPCHKFKLCQEMNRLAHLCKKHTSDGQLIITDSDPEIVEALLRYIYNKDVLLDDWKMACEVITAAYCYEIQPLVQECEEFLLKSLTLRNVCYVLETSRKCSLKKLEDKCLEICKNAAFIVFRTKAFISLPRDIVKNILEIDGLNVRGEYFLFQALWHWSKMQCISQGSPITDYHIGKEFSNLANLVKFEFMVDKQKELLPQCVKEKYVEPLQNGAKSSTASSNVKENRYVKFPLNLDENYYLSVLFNGKENPVNKNSISGSFITCIEFCVKLDAYVTRLTTLCLKKDSCSYCIKELKLSSPAGVLLSWKEGDENYVKKIRNDKCAFSVVDSTLVTETEFHAVRPLPLHMNMTYTLKITPYEKELEWPQTVPAMDRRKSDVEICLRSGLCYGLRSMVFLQGM